MITFLMILNVIVFCISVVIGMKVSSIRDTVDEIEKIHTNTESILSILFNTKDEIRQYKAGVDKIRNDVSSIKGLTQSTSDSVNETSAKLTDIKLLITNKVMPIEKRVDVNVEISRGFITNIQRMCENINDKLLGICAYLYGNIQKVEDKLPHDTEEKPLDFKTSEEDEGKDAEEKVEDKDATNESNPKQSEWGEKIKANLKKRKKAVRAKTVADRPAEDLAFELMQSSLKD